MMNEDAYTLVSHPRYPYVSEGVVDSVKNIFLTCVVVQISTETSESDPILASDAARAGRLLQSQGGLRE